MALPKNDDFANNELSIEELEAIAAGNWLGDIVNDAMGAWHTAMNFLRSNPYGQAIAAVGTGGLSIPLGALRRAF